MNILIYGPKHLINVAAIGRTFEVLGHTKIFIYDELKILSEKMGKTSRRKLNKVSAGAMQYLKFCLIDDPLQFVQNYEGRTLASVLHKESESLYKFQFKPNDLLLMGNETHGLPDEIVNISDKKISIDQVGNTESLNLGVSAAIFTYEYGRQQAAGLLDN